MSASASLRLTEARPPASSICAAALAVAAAGWAQSVVSAQPWASLAAFAVAAALFAAAVHRHPPVPETELPVPPSRSRAFMLMFSLGVILCSASGAAQFLHAPRIPVHVTWGMGLLALAISTVLGSPGSAGRWPAAVDAGRKAGGPPALPGETLVAVLLLLAVCGLVFGWELSSLPVEVHGDEAEVGLDAVRLLTYFDLFSAGWFELPSFHAFPTAIGLKLFGVSLFGLRATSALIGTGTVLVLFAVARRLWGIEVAVLAGLVLATQRFFIHLSRAGYHYVDTAFLSVLIVWLFLRLWQDRRLGAAVWCGIALGLGIQTYYASRLLPLLLVVTWLAWLRDTPAGERRVRVELLALVGLAALAVAAPHLGFFAHDWGAFWERTRDTSVFGAPGRAHLAWGYRTDNLLTILLIQLRAALTLFNYTADTSVQYGLNAPLLEPVSAVLFVLGCGAVLARPLERRVHLVAIWTVLPLVIGAALTIDAPFYPRITGLMPFAALLIALALQTLLRLARAAAPGRIGALLAAVLAVGSLTWIAANNLRTYFVEYAPTFRHSPSVEIAAFVRRHGHGKSTYMIGGAPAFFIRHGAIAFLTYGYTTFDIANFEPYAERRGFDPAGSIFVIMPGGADLVPRLEQAVGPLDLQTHRSARGDIAFLTAIPHATGDAGDPVELLTQAHEPGPGALELARIATAIVPAARWLLLAAGVLTVLFGLARGMRQPRQPGLSALDVPWWERGARWREWLVGPDARESRLTPPGWFVLAALLLILAAAVGLRAYRLVDLPAGFFCDEAGNGFNASSLWRVGQDETGARWPLYVWSFGVSYKNPIFVYSAMLPMALLGPTELAVRLTAAVYGSATVLAMFFLGRALMGPLVGLLAALLLAVLPWHLHFSRIGFELITLPFFFVLACTSLVSWTRGRHTLPQAMVLFGVCLYTYVPAKLIVPLFLAGVAVIYWRDLWARRRETMLAGFLLVVTAAPVAIFDLAHREQSGSYFRNTTLLARDEPPLELARLLVENYTAFFSREFLFEASNDRIIRHSVGEHGELYPFFLPLLILGVIAALLRRDRAMRLPLIWLALYPLAAALMNEIPSASRGFIGAPAFALVAAIGAGALLRLVGQLSQRRAVVWGLQAALAIGGLAVLVPAVQHYWALYRDEYPLYSAKYYTGFQYGHRQVVDYFRRHYDDYDQLLLTTRKSNQPETFLRFYDGLHQPPRADIAPPFEHREKMLSGSAEAYEHYASPGRRLLFAVLPEEVALFADPDVKTRVLAPDGTAAFVVVEASALKDFVSSWRVAGPFPEDDQSPPPTWTPDNPPPASAEPRWRSQRQPFAGVGLNDVFGPNVDNACAWAVNFVTSDREQEVRIYAGFDDSGEVWVNGARVGLEPTSEDEALADAQTGLAHLIAGRNAVAVRSCEAVGDWRFYFRVANPDDTPATGLTWTYGARRPLP
jgi:4-amino-4-deoxy-L-arabinose transferase-like glycosyltransferase